MGSHKRCYRSHARTVLSHLNDDYKFTAVNQFNNCESESEIKCEQLECNLLATKALLTSDSYATLELLLYGRTLQYVKYKTRSNDGMTNRYHYYHPGSPYNA